MFPNPCRFGLISLERRDARHQQTAGAIRTQGNVDIEQDAGRSMRGHPGNETLCQLGVKSRRVGVLVVVQKNHIEVGCVAKLLAAKFSICDYGKSWHLAMP